MKNQIHNRYRYTRKANFQALERYGCFVWVAPVTDEPDAVPRRALFSVPMMADGSAPSMLEAGEITHPINQGFIDAANEALEPLKIFTAQDFEEIQEAVSVRAMAIQQYREESMSEEKPLQLKAERIAKAIKAVAPWQDIRDLVDLSTGSELGTIELDILTDMVLSRLKKGV